MNFLSRLSLAVITMLIVSKIASAQEKPDLLNQQAQPVVFQDVLGTKLKSDFYKGKILVIDFWATWCAPCIATFPHYNELSKKYGSDKVLFAAITDEAAPIAAKFFKRTKKQLDAVKLTDTTHKTAKYFHADFIPYCVVIDQNNVVKWTGQSQDLTDAILKGIITNSDNKDTAAMPLKPEVKPKPQNKPIAQRALFSFGVAKSDSTKRPLEYNGSRTFKNNYMELSMANTSLGDCLEQLTGFSKVARVITNDTLKMKQLIDMSFKAGQDTTLFADYKNSFLQNEERRNLTLLLLSQALKFNIKIDKHPQKHYELVIVDTAKLHAFKSMQNRHSSFSDDYFPKFEIVGYSLRAIAVNLEASMKMVITTHIADVDRYDLSLDVSNVAAINKTLQFHGLQLQEVNSEVEFLEVDFY